MRKACRVAIWCAVCARESVQPFQVGEDLGHLLAYRAAQSHPSSRISARYTSVSRLPFSPTTTLRTSLLDATPAASAPGRERRSLASKRQLLGTLFITGVVLLWVSEVKFLQTIEANTSWHKPYFLGIALKGAWVIGLLPICLMKRYEQRARVEGDEEARSADWSLEINRETVRICFFLSLFVQAASITWIASLASTSASVNSAIYQTSCVFAYLFSIPLLSERVSFGKSAAVVLAVFGVLGVIFSKKPKGSLDDKPNAGVGELLVVLSAAFYALKEVLYKLWFPNCTSSRTPVSDAAVCVSVVGAWCTLMLPLWVLLLHSTQLELFEWPPADVARGYAIVALMMSGFQVLLFAAIAVTSPTFAAVGQLMVPPLSMLWDYIAFRFALSPLGICGSFMVIVAILFMLQNERVDEIVHPIIYRMCHRSRDLSTTALLAGTAPNPAGAAPVSSMNDESSARIAYLEAQEEKAQESPIL